MTSEVTQGQVKEEATTPPINGSELWIERWHGSEPMRGSSIWTRDSIGCHKNMIEHFGGDEETHGSVQRIVAAHNKSITALRTDRAAEQAAAEREEAMAALIEKQQRDLILMAERERELGGLLFRCQTLLEENVRLKARNDRAEQEMIVSIRQTLTKYGEQDG